MKIPCILLIAVVTFKASCQGFTVSQPTVLAVPTTNRIAGRKIGKTNVAKTSSFKAAISQSINIQSRIALFAKKGDGDNGERLKKGTAGEEDDKKRKEKNQSIAGKAAKSVSLLYSYTIIFLGAFFSFGLLLNLAGYGYTVDLEHGLVIDRMSNIRTELQFRRELKGGK